MRNRARDVPTGLTAILAATAGPSIARADAPPAIPPEAMQFPPLAGERQAPIPDAPARWKFRILDAAERVKMPATAHLILAKLLLKWGNNERRDAFPSYDSIARATNLNRRTVIEWVGWLKELGWISIRSRWQIKDRLNDGPYQREDRTNIYRFAIPAYAMPPPGSDERKAIEADAQGKGCAELDQLPADVAAILARMKECGHLTRIADASLANRIAAVGMRWAKSMASILQALLEADDRIALYASKAPLSIREMIDLTISFVRSARDVAADAPAPSSACAPKPCAASTPIDLPPMPERAFATRAGSRELLARLEHVDRGAIIPRGS